MDKSKSPKQGQQIIKLSFVGLGADKGVIGVRDLTRALEGWRAYWEISTSAYLNKELSPKPLPPDMRPQIKIQALKHGSFDVFVLVMIPLGLMIGYDIVKILWKWQWSLVERHIKSKKELISKEDAIEALKELARKFEIEVKNPTDVFRLLDLIDEALNELVEPIDYSARKVVISITSSQKILTLTSNDKRALRSGYHIEPGIASKGFERFSIKFIRIHKETGNAIITFDNPSGINQMGHEYSHITDPNVSRPKNIYTRALHEGKSLEVWGKMVRSRTTNKFQRWEITANLPSDDTPLLDIGNDE